MKIILNADADLSTSYNFQSNGKFHSPGEILTKSIGNTLISITYNKTTNNYDSDLYEFTQTTATKALLLDMILAGDAKLVDA